MYKANPGQNRMQSVLTNDSKTRVFAYSGARSGKTFEFVKTIFQRALVSDKSRHVIIRKHFAQAKKFIWMDTIPSVIDLRFPELKDQIRYDKSDYFVKFPNDSEIWIGGLDDKERADKILGGEYNTIYFNEVSEISYSSIKTALTRLAKKNKKFDGRELVNKAFFDENPPSRSHWSYKLFFEHIDPETRIEIQNKENQSVLHLKPSDNAENLPQQYLDELASMTGAARKRFWEGLFQDEVQGALWTEDLINKLRVKNQPELKRIVISVDPAVTSTEKSDETGILIIAEGFDEHYYLLDDISGIYSPNGWGNKIVLAFDKWKADRIVAEVNQGGDMVYSILRNIRPGISYKEVRATKGKMLRAEPIASLYEQGLVHHVGAFTDLEYEMTNYTGDKSEESPNRLDSLVWGLTELSGQKKNLYVPF
jgi:PBSX family phage terminase large subunit